MKYQIVVIELKSIVPGPPWGWEYGTRIGADRDIDRPNWEAYNVFRRKVIDNGGFDRYWGPHDYVWPLTVNGDSDTYCTSTFCFNTLEAVSEFYDLITDENNNPKYAGVYSVKIVEIQDDGTVVSTVKQSNVIPFPA